jgi:uncharacterized BrkB/YihY/UPF0761 family membrane protein
MATGGMVGASLALQYYLNTAGGLGPTYAAFGAVGLLLLWLYIVSYLIIVSGSVAAAWVRRWHKRREGIDDTTEQMTLGLDTLEHEAAGQQRTER